MQGTQVKFTYRDYLQLPEQDRRELIGGDFHVVPSPSVRHQAVSANLGVALRDFVGRNRLGVVLWAPMDVMLSDEDVVQPDILFVSNERRGIIAEDNISGAPGPGRGGTVARHGGPGPGAQAGPVCEGRGA